MTPVSKIFYTAMVPMGLVCACTYALEGIRNAVADYIGEVLFIPIGLLIFFCFGATIGLFAALLILPGAAFEVLEEPGNPEDLDAARATVIRSVCLVGLLFFLLATYIIIDKAYG